MAIPATRIPAKMDGRAFLTGISRNAAASAPVQAQIFVFRHLPALQMGLFLQLIHDSVQRGHMLPQPAEDLPDIDQYEGHRQDIPNNRRQIRRPYRQPQRNPEGDAAPQLHDGDHGGQYGKTEFTHRALRQPLHQIIRDCLHVHRLHSFLRPREGRTM